MSDEYSRTHVMVIGQDFLTDVWEVGCSCGWEAPVFFDTETDATDAWGDHCDVVFMEATGA